MNKILTTALFLAAGTALSNAYTLVGTATSDSSLTFTSEDNYTAWSLVAVVSDISSFASLLATGQTATQTTLFSYTEVKDSTTYSGVLRTDYSSSSGVTSAMAIALRVTSGSSASTYLTTWVNGTVSSTDYSTVYSDISSASYATVSLTRDNSSGSALYITLMDASGNVTKTYTTSSTTLKYSSAYLTTVAVGSTDYISSVSVYSSMLTENEVSSVATTLIAIPEPSAFGLLAGLGALALVASRRRRRGAPAVIVADESRK